MRGLRTAVRFPTPAIWTSGSFYRQPRFIPRPPSAVERDRVLIAHLLQSIGDQRRAKSAAAVQHHGGRFAGNFRLDIALDDALAQVDRAGRVTGAIHLSKGIIERDIEAEVPGKSTTMVLYCGGGFRSALVADALQQMGYKNAISLDGGWRAWNEAGLPIERP